MSENISKEELGKRIAEQHTHYKRGNKEIEIKRQPFYRGFSRSRTRRMDIGTFVTIKSVYTEEDSEDTFIGIYLGMIPLMIFNPVFYVPKLNKILAGRESWWKSIPKEDYTLSCEVMKEKNNFTWNDIKDLYNKLLKRAKIGVDQ